LWTGLGRQKFPGEPPPPPPAQPKNVRCRRRRWTLAIGSSAKANCLPFLSPTYICCYICFWPSTWICRYDILWTGRLQFHWSISDRRRDIARWHLSNIFYCTLKDPFLNRFYCCLLISIGNCRCVPMSSINTEFALYCSAYFSKFPLGVHCLRTRTEATFSQRHRFII
jgi:hypothetical protein